MTELKLHSELTGLYHSGSSLTDKQDITWLHFKSVEFLYGFLHLNCISKWLHKVKDVFSVRQVFAYKIFPRFNLTSNLIDPRSLCGDQCVLFRPPFRLFQNVAFFFFLHVRNEPPCISMIQCASS